MNLKRICSLFLAILMFAGCFTLAASAAGAKKITAITVTRQLNAEFSMTKIYDKLTWKLFALADANGKALKYDYNPIVKGAQYRAIEKIPNGDGTYYYAELVGTGTTKKTNTIGEIKGWDFPASWKYEDLHIDLLYNGKFYKEDGTPINDASTRALAKIGCYQIYYMNKQLTVPQQFCRTTADCSLFTVEEICTTKTVLNKGEAAKIGAITTPKDQKYSIYSVSFSKSGIASYSKGTIKALKAGTVNATVRVKDSKGNIVKKTIQIVVQDPAAITKAFRCSKCGWYTATVKKGGLTAKLAKAKHDPIHTKELTKALYKKLK